MFGFPKFVFLRHVELLNILIMATNGICLQRRWSSQNWSYLRWYDALASNSRLCFIREREKPLSELCKEHKNMISKAPNRIIPEKSSPEQQKRILTRNYLKIMWKTLKHLAKKERRYRVELIIQLLWKGTRIVHS